MHVVVSGGTGFVGTALTRALLDRGDEVTLLVREGTDMSRVDLRAKAARWSARASSDEGHEAAARADAIVNLAGAGVLDQRWTDERIEVLRDSRIATTEALARTATAARVFVSASAVGYYGMRSDDIELDETTPPGDDVLARLCVDWERAASAAPGRIALARIGIVMGKGGGAMERLAPMYRRFVGGPVGTGKQWWSWIHLADVVGSLLFALDTPRLEGPFNVTAEIPVTMQEVSRTLARVLHRPNALRVPAFALRAAIGRGAEVLLTGQRALPKKLPAAGFHFQYRNVEDAIRAAV